MGNFKYMEIVQWVLQQISTGTFRQDKKLLSETELRKKFKCSRQTVRRALDELEQRGVIYRIQGSGAFLTDQKNTNNGKNEIQNNFKTIGLILTFTDYYNFTDTIKSLENFFSQKGIALQFLSTNNTIEGEKRALKLALSRNLDGLIIEPTSSGLPCANIQLYEELINNDIPVVFINSFYPELPFIRVGLDDEKAGYIATKHLLEKGHKNIFAIFPQNHRQGHLRYLGYIRALQEMHIQIKEDYVGWYSKETNIEQIIKTKQLWEPMTNCSAILCFNDYTALPIIDYLEEINIKVPQDISVIGIDNSPIAEFRELTSINFPSEQIGQKTGELILSIIDGKVGKNVLFPPKLIERRSVKKLN